MHRYVILAVILTLALFLVTSIAPTFLNVSSSTAYAQGAFGKKSTGTTDEQRKAEELKKQKEAEDKRAEEARKEKQEKAKSETVKKTTDRSSSETKESKKSSERSTKPKDDSESRTVKSSDGNDNRKSDSANAKTPDARPDKERTSSKDDDNKKKDADNSAYKRVDERPEVETDKNKSKLGYPYDPDWITWRRRQDADMDPFPNESRDLENYTTHQVVEGICYAWMHNTPYSIRYLLPAKRKIKIYRDGIRMPDMSSTDFYYATADAMDRWKTIDYHLDIIRYNWNKIEARGYHKYKDYDRASVVHQSDVYYILYRIQDDWTIVETGFSSAREYGRARKRAS